jgi:hypothetical protein
MGWVYCGRGNTKYKREFSDKIQLIGKMLKQKRPCKNIQGRKKKRLFLTGSSSADQVVLRCMLQLRTT